jgi:hypothetical protein
VLAMPETQLFTHDDLERYLDQSKESFMSQSSVFTADASQTDVITQSNASSVDSRYWSDPGKIEKDGTRTMVFWGAGESVGAPALPANAEPLLVRVRLASFNCDRRSTEVGHDEPYFTNAAGDDERASWTYESQYFGSISQGTTKHFNADTYAFVGPVDRHLAVTFEVWEQDMDGSGWLTALRTTLR